KNDFTFKFTCVLFLCHKIKTLTRWMSNFQGSLQYGGFLFVVAIFCRYRGWDLASRNRSFTPSLTP
ncbi:hypothetical protein, partial [Vibrio cholerae]|uniref:hypothetical protein n=1 Tax=Vibrio cholerae TaxID=666 RepID=UPI001F44B2CE